MIDIKGMPGVKLKIKLKIKYFYVSPYESQLA